MTLKNGAPQKTQAGGTHPFARAIKADKALTKCDTFTRFKNATELLHLAAKIACTRRFTSSDYAAVCAADSALIVQMQTPSFVWHFIYKYTYTRTARECNYCAVLWLALSQFIAPVCFFHSGAAVGFDFIVHLGRVLTASKEKHTNIYNMLSLLLASSDHCRMACPHLSPHRMSTQSVV